MSIYMTNFYDILGVSKDASEQEIKKSYRSLSLKYHPDRNPDPSATEKYKAINEAYEVLSDEQKKQQYDMELQFGGGFPGGGFPGGGMNMGGDINDIFSMMFGNMGGMPMGGMPMGGMNMGGMNMGGMQGGPGIRIFHSGGGFPGGGFPFPGMGPDIQQMFQQISKPQPIQKTIQITLEQAFKGDTIEIQIERQKEASGVSLTEIETVMITIPKGIDQDEVLVIKDQGHIIHGQRGDIKISFKITNQTDFKRQGLDLIYQKKVCLKEALCGFSFEIHHLNGKLLSMNNMVNPTIIKPNYKKVVPGLGITKESQTGNLIIEFIVDFPDSLTMDQIDILRNTL